MVPQREMPGVVGPALLRGIVSGQGDSTGMSKIAALGTAVFGHIGYDKEKHKPFEYNYGDQRAALNELESLKSQGLPFTSLSPSSYKALMQSNSSFSAPTWTTMTALNDAGIPTHLYNIGGNTLADDVRRVAADKSIGSVIQIGAMSPENAAVLQQSGKHLGRLATDYGSGGYLQPRYHLHGNGQLGYINGMYIDPLINYDSVYIPGGKLRRWEGIPNNAKTVSIGRLATSPLFGSVGYSQTHGPRAQAFLTTGGGSGIGLPFEYRTLGALGANTDRSIMHPAPNLLDYLLDALRKKHGDNFDLNYVTGIDESLIRPRLKPADYDYLVNNIGKVRNTAELGSQLDFLIMGDLMNPKSDLYRRVASRPGGQQLLDRIAKRFSGLHVINRVPLPEMAKYYGNADYIIGLPGSSVGEMAQMYGKKTPGIIHLVPRENEFYPRHFRGNALATNAIMQPGARHNIVSVASPTLKEDIARAIQEGGFKDWGRRPIMSTQEAMAPMVNDIRRANRIRELKMLASPSGLGNRLAKGLWRAAKFIR